MGGAIFFDYSPPTVMKDSKFTDNYAIKLNHISSYPIRLAKVSNNFTSDFVYTPGADYSVAYSDSTSFYMEQRRKRHPDHRYQYLCSG